jgi:chromosome segregation ATPase
MSLEEIKEALEQLGVPTQSIDLTSLKEVLDNLSEALEKLDITHSDADNLQEIQEILLKLRNFLYSQPAADLFRNENSYDHIRIAVGMLEAQMRSLQLEIFVRNFEGHDSELKAITTDLKDKIDRLESLIAILTTIERLINLGASIAGMVAIL